MEAPTFVRTLSDLAAKVGTRVRFLVELRQAHDVQVRMYCTCTVYDYGGCIAGLLAVLQVYSRML